MNWLSQRKFEAHLSSSGDATSWMVFKSPPRLPGRGHRHRWQARHGERWQQGDQVPLQGGGGQAAEERSKKGEEELDGEEGKSAGNGNNHWAVDLKILTICEVETGRGQRAQLLQIFFWPFHYFFLSKLRSKYMKQ